ncbi:hypothetical protein D9M68_521110 [compost metagenome]
MRADSRLALPVPRAALRQFGPGAGQLRIAGRRQAEGAQPVGKGALAGQGKALHQRGRTAFAETRDAAQLRFGQA